MNSATTSLLPVNAKSGLATLLNTQTYSGIHHTEQTQNETERAKMLEEILHRNKILEQFTYIVSHNLRAPVANLKGMAELLMSADMEVERKLEFLPELEKAVYKLDNIVLDLHTILQVDQCESKIREIVNLSDIIADIVYSLQQLIQKEQIIIITDFSAVNCAVTVKGYLYSILLNLISNSIKYKRPGIESVVHISSGICDGHLRIYVKDNGLGIDLSKNKGSLFGLYKRFHTHVEGKGMGLFMAKTQTELLGGSIAMSSVIDTGTIVTLDFPNQ